MGITEHDPDFSIVTTRLFSFSRPHVFQAWKEPEHLKNWWGPAGFTNTFHQFEFKEGGRWIFTMHGPDRGHYENACTFLIIREPEVIVWDRQSKPLFQVNVTFEEIEENITRVIFRQIFQTAEECNKLRRFVPEKNEENMDRLEDELRKMSASSV